MNLINKIKCYLIGHKMKFQWLSAERHKVWKCRRCGVVKVGKYVGE